MTRTRPRHAASSLALLILLVTAGTVALQAGPALRYSVRLRDLGSASLEIALRMDAVSSSEPLILRSVPAYMANPLAAPIANPLSKLSVTGLKTGAALEFREERTGDQSVIRIDRPEESLEIDYIVSIAFQDTPQTRDYPIRLPFMDSHRSLLYGNYVFIFPEFKEEPAAGAGRPIDIEVQFKYPPQTPLWGAPDRTELHSIYQLMSLQFGFGGFERDSFRAAGLPVALVSFKGEFSASERRAIMGAATKAFEQVVGFFGGAPFDQFSMLIYRASGIGGMEGTFSCQIYVNAGLDVANESSRSVRSFYSVILHEIFHSWNPISLYALNDPWIKEGITGYYGEVLSARAKLLLEEDLQGNFGYYTKQLAENPLLSSVSLTDSRIWHNEYSSESWRTLTYEKGRAVALLLDVSIRERTGNQSSLDDVLRELYDRFSNRSYSHQELLDTVESVTGQDFSAFFHEFISGAKAPSVEELDAARRKALELGILHNSTKEHELAAH